MTTPRFAAIAGAAALALLLTACTPDKTQVSPDGSGPDATAEPAPVPSPVDDVYDQQVNWVPCGGLECAIIQVPLDWSDLDGPTVDLAINRSVARDPDNRIGSLLINPGGPGGSGLDLTEYFVTSAGDALLDAYDVVGFDPRGVGASSPIDCGDDATIDEFYLPDRLVESEAEMAEVEALGAEFAEGCREASGALVENVDTVSAARDMDVIRAALGDDELHYLGYSYGTRLGATYAQLYPQNVGRMVLDGAVDFLLPGEDLSRGQAEGFERALTNFLTWCVSREECALSGGVEQARTQLAELIRGAVDEPYDTGTRWELNGNLMIYGVVVTLYDQASWPYLDLALDEVIHDGTARIMYELANFYLARNGGTGEYLENKTWAFTAIGCLTGDESDDWSFEELEDYRAMVGEASPTFGWWFSSGAGCSGWPWTASETITDLDATADAGPILVIGTTNDPATPFAWAESLAERLGDATLLSYDGEGHTAYGRSNQCVINAVDGYLVDGQMPDSGMQC